jgi:hypothetical protein
MKIWPISVSTLVALAGAASALAQGGLTISQQPPPCFSSLCGKTVISASIAGEPAPDSVRVYFRSGAESAEYYIEMTKSAGGYEAVLPSPLRETTSVVYRVVAVTADGATSSTEPATVPVTTDCKPAALSAEQSAAPANQIIGLTDVGQTGAPKGFSCAGITNVIGVDQTLSPNNACEEVKLANSDPCFVPASKGQQAGTGYLGAAALGAAVVAGAVIIENNNDDNNGPVSPSRP